MPKNSDDYLIFPVGILFGVLTGLIAGIIFSPKSGVEMRKELKGIAKNFSDEVPTDAEVAKKAFYKNMDRLKLAFEAQINKINEAVKAGRMASAKRREELESGY